MPAAPATHVFRDAAHRRTAIRSLAWRAPLGAIAFAAVGPLVGMVLVLIPLFGMMIVGNPAGASAAIYITFFATITAYYLAIIPAAFTGFWVALLATFAATKKQLYAGAAAIGAASTFLFSSVMFQSGGKLAPANPGLIVLALVGATAAFLCTRLFIRWPIESRWPFGSLSFESRSHHRDRLARERAERLARERTKA